MKSYVSWILRHGFKLWAAALVLAVPAAWRTCFLYAHLQTELEELLPRRAPSVVSLDELRSRMPGLQYLGVVVDAGKPENIDAANRFLDDLAARIRAYPPALARAARTGTAAEHEFLEKNAPLYIDVPDLERVAAMLEERRDYEVEKASGSLVDENAPPPPLDFSGIRKRYEDRLPKGGKTDGDRYASRALARSLLLIEAGEKGTGAKGGAELLDRVNSDIAALGGPAAYANGMTFGYSGDVAISVEETRALLSDLSVSSVLVILAVALVIVAYYKWWRSVLILVPPLLLATLYAFSVASLLGVDELNANTAFLGSIIVGNGINFGIVLLARYVEERRVGMSVTDALSIAVAGSRVGTLSAALAAGVAYASLCITEFRGFRQFGIVGGVGMVFSWLAAFVLMPPLIAWVDRGRTFASLPAKASGRSLRPLMDRVADFTVRHARSLTTAAVAMTVAAAWTGQTFNLSRLEYDFSKLRRADTWTQGEGYWGEKMNELLGTYLTPLVILTGSESEANEIEARLREQMRAGSLSTWVASLRAADDVLPANQEAKLNLANRIREDLTPGVRAGLTNDERSAIDKMLGSSDLKPVTLSDLPSTFTAALRERDGSMGKAILVYPKPSSALWQGPAIQAFTRELRAVAAATHGRDPSARVAGALPLSSDILESIERDSPRACAAALGGVIVVVLLLFRWHRMSAYVMGSLIVGVLWLLAGTMWLGVKINFANFIAFPITFGIGVDYSVNVVSRYLQEPEKGVAHAVRSTGSAVALCSLTTILGYSSLLMAQNRALYLFGVVAVLGEIACLSTGVVFLPALLSWLERRSAQWPSLERGET